MRVIRVRNTKIVKTAEIRAHLIWKQLIFIQQC